MWWLLLWTPVAWGNAYCPDPQTACIGVNGDACNYVDFDTAYNDAGTQRVMIAPAFLEVSDPLVLDRPGVDISGASADCRNEAPVGGLQPALFQTGLGAIFEVDVDTALGPFDVTIEHLTATLGRDYVGGLVQVHSQSVLNTLRLEDVLLDSGTAAVFGGCVAAFGPVFLDIRDSVIQDCEVEGLDGSGNGGAIWVDDGGVLRLVDTVIRRNSAAYAGGAIQTDGAEVRIIGASVLEDNSAGIDGGAISAAPGTWLRAFDTSQIRHNTAGGSGGGVFIAGAGARLELLGQADVWDNFASGDGGGLYVGDGASFEMRNNPAVHDNEAQGDGGGIRLDDLQGITAKIWGSAEIDNNIASGQGGGIAISDGDLEVPWLATGLLWVHGNTAGSHGGGISLVDGELRILSDTANHQTLIGALLDPVTGEPIAAEMNVAGGDGGGIYARDALIDTTLVRLEATELWGLLVQPEVPANCVQDLDVACATSGGVRVVGNNGYFGGGVRLLDADLETNGAVIAKNVAVNGGGVYATGSAQVTMHDSTVFNNSAGAGGGLLLDGEGVAAELTSDWSSHDTLCATAEDGGVAPFQRELDRYCAEVSFNTADNYGGGAIVRGGATFTATNVGFFHNSAGMDNAQLQIQDGSSVTLRGSLVAHGGSANGDVAVWVGAGSSLVSRATTYGHGDGDLRIVYVPGAVGSFDGNIVWDPELFALGIDKLSVPPFVIPGACNIGLGVGNLASTFNLEGQDPQFMPMGGTEFHLTPGSQAIDRCTSGSAFDMLGVERPQGPVPLFDMGAYEVDP